MTCLGAARGTSAATGLNTRDVRDFDIAFITDVHIERGKVATAKFGKTVAEINTLKPAFVWDMGDMSLYPNSATPILIVPSSSKCHFMPVPAITISL